MGQKKFLTPLTLSPVLRIRADEVKDKGAGLPPILQKTTAAVLRDLEKPQNATEALTAIHRLQRWHLVLQLGLENNEAVHDALQDEKHFPLWRDYQALTATDEQKDMLARLMYEGDPKRQAPVILNLDNYSRDIAERIVTRLAADKTDIDLWIIDPLFHLRILTQLDAQQAAAYGLQVAQRYDRANRLISLRVNDAGFNGNGDNPDPAIRKAYTDNFRTHYLGAGNREKMYTLTELPTPADAELDGIPYDDYVDLFFRMCGVDWQKVIQAQRHLIAQLDAGSVLHFTNADGTDLTMDITGFTFCNSPAAKNVPGSEVFSAPHKTSVQGRIVAKGRFIPPTGGAEKLIENITLEFKDGKVVHYHADTGMAHLKEAIETDEGSHYVGEIGIGTNPVLRRHVVNGLMVEKIGGSFHIALGRAYTFSDYLGDPVHVDNGNASNLHWDITTMLYGRKGRMTLDGTVIIDDGRFVDAELSYLNGEY